MRTALSVAAVVLGLVGVGGVGAGEKEAARERIDQLIGQLGSPKFADREAAGEALEALGEPALPALKAASRSADVEVGRRAEELFCRIERRVELARILEPKRVHLALRGTPVPEAVAELRRQTGYSLQLTGDVTQLARKTVTLDTGDVPFWEALRQFCHKVGLTEQRGPVTGRRDAQHAVNPNGQIVISRFSYNGSAYAGLALAEGSPPAVPTYLAGAVRFRALPVSAAAWGEGRFRSEGAFVLDVTAEQRLVWQGVAEVRIEKCLDDQSQELTATATLPPQFSSSAREVRLLIQNEQGLLSEPPTQIPFRVQRGAKPSRLLKEVSGAATCQVQTPPEALVTIEDVLQAGGRSLQTSDGLNVKVLDVTRQDGQVKVRLQEDIGVAGAIVFNARGNLVRINNLALRIGSATTSAVGGSMWTLYDRNGHRYRNGPHEVSIVAAANGVAQEFRLTYLPERDQGEPVKLVQTGRRQILLEIPFTLKDVPLP
jgi:hypothetical protein